MNNNELLAQLLESGKTLAEQSQKWAEEKVGIPEQGSERQTAIENLGKGAIGAGVLSLLLGTHVGRRLTGSALKLGSLAALGGIAYKTFQTWQGVHSTKALDEGTPIDQLDETGSEGRSRILLKAIIAMAKADGHIDDDELQAVNEKIASLDLDANATELIQAELAKPLNAADIAADVDSPTAAAEIYLVSFLLSDEQNSQEKAYLGELAKQLGLKPTLVADLERKIRAE